MRDPSMNNPVGTGTTQRPQRRHYPPSNQGDLRAPSGNTGRGRGGARRGGGAGGRPPRIQENIYPEYETLSDVLNGIREGTVLLGELSIAVEWNNVAFVRHATYFEKDVMICGNVDRNRAMHGDIVAVRLLSGVKSNKKQEADDEKEKEEDEEEDEEEDKDEEDEEETVSEATLLKDENESKVAQVLDPTREKVVRARDYLSPLLGQQDAEPARGNADTVQLSLALHEFRSKYAASFPPWSVVMNKSPSFDKGKIVYIFHRTRNENIYILPACGKADTASGGCEQGAHRTSNFLKPFERRHPEVSLLEVPASIDRSVARYVLVRYLPLWRAQHRSPAGRVVRELGPVDTLDGEMAALAAQYLSVSYETTPAHEKEVLVPSVPSGQPAPADRRDFRGDFTCTIDPLGAQDLDDAISIAFVHTEEGAPRRVRVGVHIADVTYYVREHSSTDKAAAQRGSSCYFVGKVLHMLPTALSVHHCSLVPGVDKFTVSVCWEMDLETCAIVPGTTWLGRGLIQSRFQLTYEQAGRILQGNDDTVGQELLTAAAAAAAAEEAEAGATRTATHSATARKRLDPADAVPELFKGIRALHRLSTRIREDRVARGAMKISHAKVAVSLGENSGRRLFIEPQNIERTIQAYLAKQEAATEETAHAEVVRLLPSPPHDYESDAKKMVEDFMLLANTEVAQKIYQYLPNHALLRCLPTLDLQRLLQIAPVDLSCMDYHAFVHTLNERLPRCISIQALKRAVYMPSHLGDEELFYHLPLRLPVYTHFTSPIRRYADMIVHRSLLLALRIEQEVLLLTASEVGKEGKDLLLTTIRKADVPRLFHHRTEFERVCMTLNRTKQDTKLISDEHIKFVVRDFFHSYMHDALGGVRYLYVESGIITRITRSYFVVHVEMLDINCRLWLSSSMIYEPQLWHQKIIAKESSMFIEWGGENSETSEKQVQHIGDRVSLALYLSDRTPRTFEAILVPPTMTRMVPPFEYYIAQQSQRTGTTSLILPTDPAEAPLTSVVPSEECKMLHAFSEELHRRVLLRQAEARVKYNEMREKRNSRKNEKKGTQNE